MFILFVSELDAHIKAQGLPEIELCTNDVEGTSHLMYADDLSLFSDNVIGLQRLLNCLEQFCSKWGLAVNLNKTKIVVFRNGGYLRQSEEWFYKGEKMEVTTYYNYLGLLFSSRLVWSKCIDNFACRAMGFTAKVRQLCYKFNNVNVNILFKIFDVKIKPALLYGSEIWGVVRRDDIEHVQIKYCKMVLIVGKTTWFFASLKDCGRYHLFVDYHCRAIKYWCKLLSLGQHRFAKKCYLQLLLHDESGRKNWASEIRKLLCSLGFGYAWFCQSIGNTPLFVNCVKDRLISMSVQELNANATVHFASYLDYHPTPFAAPYILEVNSYHKRRLFAMLHCNSLPIRNNLLRFKMVDDNLCIECKQAEDEYHVLFDCKKYDDLRLKFLPAKLLFRPSLQKLYKLLQTSDKDHIFLIILFLREALKDRLN